MSEKVKEKNLLVFSDFNTEIKKTKEMSIILKKFEISNSIIILDKNSKDKIEKSIRNIPNIKVTDINHFSAFDLVKFKKIVLTESSVKELEKGIHKMDKLNLFDKILAPMVTEKSTNLSEQNKIVFKVPSKANKKEFKKQHRKNFKVNVTKINIVNKQNRTKLSRGRKVKVSGFKKAIITLKKGQSIDLTTGI